MTPLSTGHDLTARDPGCGNYHPPTPQTRARAERLAAMTDEEWAEIVRKWKARWGRNKRKERAK